MNLDPVAQLMHRSTIQLLLLEWTKEPLRLGKEICIY